MTLDLTNTSGNSRQTLISVTSNSSLAGMKTPTLWASRSFLNTFLY